MFSTSLEQQNVIKYGAAARITPALKSFKRDYPDELWKNTFRIISRDLSMKITNFKSI
jgi:hypothetical protein